jgi:hypothetical protein
MDANQSQSSQQVFLNSESQKSLDYDQKINQITFQQIEIYLQNLVKFE